MKTISIVINTLVLGSLAFATSSPGDVIYNNLGGNYTIGNDTLLSGPLFDSFTPTSTETLSGLQLVVNSFVAGQSGPIEVGLYGTPANPILEYPLISDLGTIDVSFPKGGVSEVVTVSPLNNPTVTAGTRYWIGLSSVISGADVYWAASSDITGPGVGGEYYAFNGGSSVIANSSGTPFAMDLTGSPVPDVSNPALLLALSGAGLLGATWKSSPRRGRILRSIAPARI
jgi:hypothetical protein